MTELGRSDFNAFMREVTGFDPFPWQRRLLDTVLSTGWPELLDLPTGTGKTTTLLIALFALAVAPERSPRRIALIVDRRIIVGQVDGFARRIETALGDPQRPVSARVAARLRGLCSAADAKPVRVVQLRGGIARDDSWIGSPDQPTIIASTVDQIGSRLLFRGYGVSEGMRPIHAGILSRDSLFLLDEVHLAAAFEETLLRLQGTYANWAEVGETGRRLVVVRMSATPRAGEAAAKFGLDDDDRAHPVLARRLAAARPATLELVKTKRTTSEESDAGNYALVAEAACKHAQAAASKGARAIGVVVNRVDTARRTAARLRASDVGRVLLMTGRMRPYDKAAIQAGLDQTVAVGAVRSADAKPTFVVATSCIEAGADLDFDTLVTEVASLDALRQRFGRLNRLGEHDSVQAWVLARNDQLGAKSPSDPVYGEALRGTWEYLVGKAKDNVVDFGLANFPEPREDERVGLLPPAPDAPLLFPNYLDMWAETRPAPHPDPDVSLWLHGKGSKPERDINVVFRADVPDGASDAELVGEVVEFITPVAAEAVSVRKRELEEWLDGGDVWRWTADGLEFVAVSALGIGDTIVVPASRGGLGAGTWDPSSTVRVEDVAERAYFDTHGVAKLRLDPMTLPEGLRDAPRPVEADDPDALEAARRECVEWLNGLVDRLDSLPEDWRPLLRELSNPTAKRKLSIGTSVGGKAVWRATVLPPKRAVEATTEDAVSVFTGLEVSLVSHLEDVEAWATSFATSAGLDRAIAVDVGLAALLHDIGKADLRFQALLSGGDPIRAAGGEPLAKSRQFGSAKARTRAQQRSNWPAGFRHELISLALLTRAPSCVLGRKTSTWCAT